MTITSITPRIQPTTTHKNQPESAQPALQSVPDATEARGFALYIGIDELKSASSGVSLPGLVDALKQLVEELAPGAETHATVALAPRGAGGKDVDIVRRALKDPSIRRVGPEAKQLREGVKIDLSRKRVTINDTSINLTYKEFRLLEHLIDHSGQTVARAQLLAALWDEEDEEQPNERTIDVHVRRLRSKLGSFEDIVRTVRGIGYRFDDHADVAVYAA